MIRSHRELARDLAEALSTSPDRRLAAGAAAVEKELARTARDRFEREAPRQLFSSAADPEFAALIVDVAKHGLAIWQELNRSGALPIAHEVEMRIVGEVHNSTVPFDLVREVARVAVEMLARNFGPPAA